MLQRLISRVSHNPVITFTADDLYRICAVIKNPQDVLGLQQQTSFLEQLASQYRQLDPSQISPFQKGVLEDVLSPFVTSSSSPCREDGELSLNSSGELSASTTAKTSTSVLGDPTALECLTAIWSLIDETRAEKSEFSGDRMRTLETYMKEIEVQLRQLTPTETASLVKALSSIHYRNYQHTALLARRSCEIASQLEHNDACVLYHNLTRLQSMDSLMPLVLRIIHFEDKLTVKEVQLLAQALEKQSNSSFAGGKLLVSVLNRGAAIVKNSKSPVFHRSFFAAAARYNFSRHTSIMPVLNDLSRFKTKDFNIKDVSVLLRSITTLGIDAKHPVYPHLIKCIEESVNTTLDVRQVDVVMDILSEVPADSTKAMQQLMTRLEKDAGKLTITQLVNVLQLLSSYPLAKGQVCLVSLSFAAVLRAESIEATALEDILVSLAQLDHFTDDFFGLVRMLFKKGGFKKFDTLHSVLSNCPPHVLQSVDGEEMTRMGILQLAPILNDQELQLCRKLLMEKGINDKALHQRVLSRAKQLQRGNPGVTASFSGNGRGRGGSKRRHYDPMDDLIQ